MRECWKAHVLLKLELALYTADCHSWTHYILDWSSTHACTLTAGALLYIKEENLIVVKPE